VRLSEVRSQQVVTYRLGKMVEGAGAGRTIRWSEWKRASIFVKHNKLGAVVMVSPGDVWTEYSVSEEYSPPDSPHPDGLFESEGYCMEIEGLTGL
jgi:hypothetical protein